MQWNAPDIAAFIGAAAWLPQIGKWIHKWATRPRLMIIPDKSPEVGYTIYGPIFNIPLALVVNREQVLVTRLTIKLTHSNGDTHLFSWQGMSQTFSEIRDREGIQQGAFARDESAIALQVSKDGMVARSFRFQEDTFKEAVDKKLKVLTTHNNYLRETQPANATEATLINSEPFHELANSMNELFWWQAGTYTVEFSAESPQKPKMGNHSISFALNQSDVDDLRQNIENARLTLEDTVMTSVEGYQKKARRYVWKYPRLETAIG